MSHSPGALPRSFDSGAEDVVVVLQARQLRRVLRRVCTVLCALCGVCVLAFLGWALFGPACFTKFGCRSMQSEAKGNLKVLYVAQESFRGEHERYGERAVDVGFVPRGNRLRYRYALTDVTADGFTAWAFGVDDDVKGDVWRITETLTLENVRNVCR